MYLVCPPGACSVFIDRIPARWASETVERARTDTPGQMVLFD